MYIITETNRVVLSKIDQLVALHQARAAMSNPINDGTTRTVEYNKRAAALYIAAVAAYERDHGPFVPAPASDGITDPTELEEHIAAWINFMEGNYTMPQFEEVSSC